MIRDGSVHVHSLNDSGRSSARIIPNSPISGAAPSQHARPLAHQRQARRARGLDHSRALAIGQGKDACEETAGREARGRDPAVVADVAAQLEPARDLLRMIAFDASAEREVRGAAEHEIEPLLGRENARVAKIAEPDVRAIAQPVEAHGAARQRDAFLLRLDRHQACAGQAPGGHGRDAADAAAKIENGSR